MPGSRPNVLYLHSHDTGRYVQPYGHPVPTPNIQRLADQGLLFRQAFCASSTCSGSRAALLTGQHGPGNGMLGLAHRGWRLTDYRHHLVHTLHAAGYTSALIGEQHISEDPGIIGYERVVDVDSNHVDQVGPAAIALLEEERDRPLFLSVGFFETHRNFFAPSSVRDALYSLPPGNLPDLPAVRRDLAAFKASARSLDQGVGAVIDALDARGLADDTLVILTTDHGLAFPGAKATLTDAGLGVLLIMRGPGGFHGGRVCEAMVSHLDVFPTLCDLLELEPPDRLEGRSLLPLARGEVDRLHDELFAGVTYHAAYEPQRAVRTARLKYIHRFPGAGERAVLPNIDDGPSKDALLALGWGERRIPAERLHDLVLDPHEQRNLAEDAGHADVLGDLRDRLHAWMRATDDPLLYGDVAPPPGARVNEHHQRSASEPSTIAGLDAAVRN